MRKLNEISKGKHLSSSIEIFYHLYKYSVKSVLLITLHCN